MAPLELYIQRARQNPQEQIFDRSPHIQTPTLVHNRINRILTYRGCFNPPHAGHKEALCHAFFRSGSDLNIIAAIIVLVDDDGVLNKLQQKEVQGIPPETYLLTKEKRIKLWNGGDLYGGWHYCFDGASDDDWEFENAIQEEAARDKFDVRFVTVTGPDWVNNPSVAFRGETIVVGAGEKERTNFLAENALGFKQLAGYGQWREMPLSKKMIHLLGTEGSPKWLEEKLMMLFPEMAKNLPQDGHRRHEAVTHRLRTQIWRMGAVRVCQYKSGPSSRWLRFVPLRFIGMKGGADFVGSQYFAMSSTLIRSYFQTKNDPELLVALDGVALNPALYIQYIRQNEQSLQQIREKEEKEKEFEKSRLRRRETKNR